MPYKFLASSSHFGEVLVGLVLQAVSDRVAMVQSKAVKSLFIGVVVIHRRG